MSKNDIVELVICDECSTNTSVVFGCGSDYIMDQVMHRLVQMTIVTLKDKLM